MTERATTAGDEDLVRIAALARQRAYAPHSNYKVGAALRTARGKVTSGANVENASYGLTICAERAALFAAVNAGDKGFDAIAIVAGDLPVPCGACLQVLSEFCSDDLRIVLASADGQREVARLGALLPRPFRLKPG